MNQPLKELIFEKVENSYSCLNHCVTEDVFLYFSSPNKAIVIREVDSFNKDNLMLCMPIMIQVK